MPSGYPNLAGPTPTAPSPKPRTDGSDVVLSTVLLVISAISWATAAGMEFFAMAFTDYCPAETCSADRAFLSIAVGLSAAAALFVIGAVLAIIRNIRRRLGWAFAGGTVLF